MIAVETGMNGFISKNSSRITRISPVVASVVAPLCLIAGFLAGYEINLDPESITHGWRTVSSEALSLADTHPSIRPLFRMFGYQEKKDPSQMGRPWTPYNLAEIEAHRSAEAIPLAFDSPTIRGEPAPEVLDPTENLKLAGDAIRLNFQKFMLAGVEQMATNESHPTPKKAIASREEVDTIVTEQASGELVQTGLGAQEQARLKDLLLQEQLKPLLPAKPLTAQIPPQTVAIPPAAPAIPVVNPKRVQATTLLPSSARLEVFSSVHEFPMDAGTCGLGVSMEFDRVVNDPSVGVDIHVCPAKLDWLSKDWDGKGWARFEGPEHRTTIVRFPAPNHGNTLMLDDRALAAISIRSGLRIAKGMGIIAGPVPEGFKIEFSGRSEDTEYFESNHKKYFAILNAEPGAGVVELVSDEGQSKSSSVFAPVLEDAVTYLDLSTPALRNIPVKVLKGEAQISPDVAGLTVGLSTQSGIQAITQSNGSAMLQNVPVVPGFPYFVDVSSRRNGLGSFTYRAELKHPTQDGTYLIHQMPEKGLYRWLGQIQQDLSDQAAMITGTYSRSRIDGFRNDYQVKIDPLGNKGGLEPMTYSILWNQELEQNGALEGDQPAFMSVQVPDGLSRVILEDEHHQVIHSDLIPVSPRVIHVVSP